MFGAQVQDDYLERVRTDTQTLYRCTVCLVNSSNYDNFKSHCDGQKHAKKLRQSLPGNIITSSSLGTVADAGDYYIDPVIDPGRTDSYKCPICDIYLNGRAPYNQHVRGQKHVKACKIKGIQGANVGQSLARSISEPVAPSPPLQTYISFGAIGAERSALASSLSNSGTSNSSGIGASGLRSVGISNVSSIRSSYELPARTPPLRPSVAREKREEAPTALVQRKVMGVATIMRPGSVRKEEVSDEDLRNLLKEGITIAIPDKLKDSSHGEAAKVKIQLDVESIRNACIESSTEVQTMQEHLDEMALEDLVETDEEPQLSVEEEDEEEPESSDFEQETFDGLFEALIESCGSRRCMRHCVVCDVCCSSESEGQSHLLKDIHLLAVTRQQAELEQAAASAPLEGNLAFLEGFIEASTCDMPGVCVFHCKACNKHLNGLKPKNDHEKSGSHLKNVLMQQTGEQKAAAKPGGPSWGYCSPCNKGPFSTYSEYQKHVSGREHQKKEGGGAGLHVPEFSSQSIRKNMGDYYTPAWDTLVGENYRPRPYQLELFQKCMTGDSLCFLPTGMGKTLVAAMVISNMLKENPIRPAVLLVPTTLLVTQQTTKLQQYLRGIRHVRSEAVGEGPRQVVVKGACGAQGMFGGPVDAKADVIVATHGWFHNLLRNKRLKWEHFCCAVFDEAHHTQAGHSYAVMLKEYNAPLDRSRRPKILGLTASPAGQKSHDATVIKLRQVLQVLGDARLVAVTRETDNYRNFQPSAQPEVVSVDMTQEEMELEQLLQQYIANYCRYHSEHRSTEEPNILREVDVDPSGPLENKMTTDVVNKIISVLKPMLEVSPDDKEARDRKLYALCLCGALLALREVGIIAVKEELRGGPDRDRLSLDLMLQMQEVEQQVGRCERATSQKGNVIDKVERELDIVTRPSLSGGDAVFVLLLVKRVAVAYLLDAILKKARVVQNRNLRVAHVVGQGGDRLGSRGMTRQQQEQVMKACQKKQVDVLVATSVAEEGLDIPQCSLVLALDPPANPTSLVQIRGRARAKDSRLVMLCQGDNQREQLQRVLDRERHMNSAVEEVLKMQEASSLY